MVTGISDQLSDSVEIERGIDSNEDTPDEREGVIEYDRLLSPELKIEKKMVRRCEIIRSG